MRPSPVAFLDLCGFGSVKDMGEKRDGDTQLGTGFLDTTMLVTSKSWDIYIYISWDIYIYMGLSENG